jgi:glycosyltransferase involved in cell wall biosynthesis
MRDIAVFHPGTQHSHETALAFQRAGRLAWLATEIFYDEDRFPYRFLAHLPRATRERLKWELKRRHHPDIDPSLVRTFGVWEWIERASMRAGLRTVEHYANEWGNARFGRRVAKMAKRDGVAWLWGFDTSSLTAFVGAKRAGIRCVLEHTIGYPRLWNRLLSEERARIDAAFDPYPRPYPESDLARVDREIDLADRIVCGSTFVRDTMIAGGISGHKIAVIPSGADARRFHLTEQSPAGQTRLLFVGHFGLRKGAWYLLEALRRLEHVPGLTVTVLGKRTVPLEFVSNIRIPIQFIGHQPKHLMPLLYRYGDVLVLPTLFEGSAITVYEALAAGLPVITTPNAGSVVRDGEEGFIIPPRDADALADRIERLHRDHRLRVEMSVRARARALEYTWDRYGQELVRMMSSLETGLAASPCDTFAGREARVSV